MFLSAWKSMSPAKVKVRKMLLPILKRHWNSTSKLPRPRGLQRFALSRLRLGRLKPQPFREIKRRLESAGFIEVSQKGSHVKFVRRSGELLDTAIVPNKREVP